MSFISNNNNSTIHFLPTRFYYFPCVESTNDTAFKLLAQGAETGTVIIANMQTKGRGRWGRYWMSPEGKGVYTSFILDIALWPLPIERFTLFIAYCVSEFLQADYGIDSKIRWPNDIIVDNKKLAGILTDIRYYKDKRYFITGIGINTLFLESELPDLATSMNQLVKEEIVNTKVSEDLFGCIDNNLFKISQGDYEVLESKIILKSSSINRPVEILLKNSNSRRGIVLGFTQEGALLFKDGVGVTEIIHSSEVEYLKEL